MTTGSRKGYSPPGPEVVGFEALPDGGGVLHHPQGHAAVNGGLELEQDEDVEPAAAGGLDAPEHVGVALVEGTGDEAGGHALEGGEVEVGMREGSPGVGCPTTGSQG